MRKRILRVMTGALAVAVMATSVLPAGYGGFNKSIEKTYAATDRGDHIIVSGDWKYKFLSEEGIEIVEYTGEAKDLVVPSQIDGYSVTRIGDWVFSDCANLTSVELPEGVKSIGYATFAYSDSLVRVELPEGLISIGEAAFASCDSLTDIELPAGLINIGAEAFLCCDSLTSIELPEGITSIAKSTFANCGLTSIEVPAGVVSIGEEAFSGCGYLESIVLQEGLKTIDEYAFYSSGLTSIKLPEGLTSIKEGAFYFCERLENVELPEGLTSIDKWMFGDCEVITSIKIPSSVTSIGDAAFIRCEKLADVELPEGLKSIEESAFQGCGSLTSIKLPDGLTNMGKFVFSGSGLISIELPNGITSVGNETFSWCKSLVSVKLPENLTSIDDDAFIFCESLASLEISSTVTNIGNDAFTGCDKLVIFSPENSYAHKYALENGIAWVKSGLVDIQVNAEVALDKTTYTYDGKAKTPSITVKVGENVLVEGTDYTVAYSNNVNSGIASVTVTGIGNYTGTIKKEFKINPSAVKNFTYSARSSSAVALKWTKNTSADGYVIEQYKGGKWVAIKTITNNATVSHKVTGLSASTACKFRIKAYKTVGKTKLYSGYTTKTVNTLPAGVKNFTYSARSSSAVVLKWTKNTSASGYVIEQYKGGKWVTIKTITKNTTTSHKVTGLKASTANKFRIKAYKSYGTAKLYSGYVTKSVNTLPSGVSGFTYSARTNKTITLKWNKNTSATGYVIEQYKNGKWVAIKTVTKNSTVSHKVTGLKKATSYKFRIKAYKSYGSTKLYSGYVTKTIKTK